MYLSGIIFPGFFREEVLEDTKGVIKIRKSKDRQYNGQMQEEKHRSLKCYTKI